MRKIEIAEIDARWPAALARFDQQCPHLSMRDDVSFWLREHIDSHEIERGQVELSASAAGIVAGATWRPFATKSDDDKRSTVEGVWSRRSTTLRAMRYPEEYEGPERDAYFNGVDRGVTQGQLFLPLSSGIARVLPMHTATITAKPQQIAIRPISFFMSATSAIDFEIRAFGIGCKMYFVGRLAAAINQRDLDFWDGSIAGVSVDVIVVARYVGNDPQGAPFQGIFRCLGIA